MPTALHSHRHQHTLVLTLSNPEQRNALGPEMYAAGLDAIAQAASNKDVRSVVICGEGAHFCGGGNLQRLQDTRAKDPSVAAASLDGLHRWIAALHALPKPVIAAVEGAAAGAGFSLALACDFVVAADNSVFVMAYSNVGLSPDGGGSWHLARQLPRASAMALMMLGERVKAERLLQLGLVHQVCTSGQALTQALALAETLNARAPNTLASIKALAHGAVHASLAEHLAQEQTHFVRNLHHPNGGEGIQAFLDKRAPKFQAH